MAYKIYNMKKTIYYFVLVSVIILSTAVSCKKPQAELEEELPTGENTMYCYIDEQLYIPEIGNTIPLVPAIYYSVCSDGISLNIGADDVVFHFENGIQQTGIITLNQSNYDTCWVLDNHAFYATTENVDGIMLTKLYYTHDGSGTVNITYLSENKRQFEGTFEMIVYHENTGVTKQITEGHFNINLDTL